MTAKLTFSRQELDTLIEALGAWERSVAGPPESLVQAISGGLPGLMGCDDPNCNKCRDARASLERQFKASRDKATVISERSVLLRAKLIGLRDSLDADKLLADSQKEPGQ